MRSTALLITFESTQSTRDAHKKTAHGQLNDRSHFFFGNLHENHLPISGRFLPLPAPKLNATTSVSINFGGTHRSAFKTTRIPH